MRDSVQHIYHRDWMRRTRMLHRLWDALLAIDIDRRIYGY